MNKSKTPMNQAERPLFVMKQAVTAAIITMVTAPGQNCANPLASGRSRSSPARALEQRTGQFGKRFPTRNAHYRIE
jgi:hypothetical protein